MVWSLPFPESTITSPFGYRTAPYKAFHTGVDFGWSNGKAIKAPAAGKVVAKGYNANKTSGWGHYLWVEADDGAFYGVAHMRAASAYNVGDRVVLGATLGYVGATGAAATYGPHLHLSISTGTKAQALALNRAHLVDPIAYINARSAGTAGGGTTPFQPGRKKHMTTVYWDGQNPTGGQARWALGGDSPGTTANWIETGTKDLADKWAAAHGPIVDLGSAANFANFRSWYQQPVKTTGGPVSGDVTVKVDNSDVIAALEQLGVKIAALPAEIDQYADGKKQS